MPKQPSLTVDETVSALIDQYTREAKGPGPIWAGAARSIVAVLTNNSPENAQRLLRKAGNQCKAMSVSSFYSGAANDLQRALRRSKRQHKISAK